jgi:preprotein translocase subunit SecE
MGLGDYLKETRVEMNHVTWPTRAQAIQYTVIVILISLVVAAILGAFDSLFHSLLSRFI